MTIDITVAATPGICSRAVGGLPGGVEDPAVAVEPDELIRGSDKVDVALLAVVDEGVGLPELV